MSTRIGRIIAILTLLMNGGCTNSLVMEVSSEIPTAATETTERNVGLLFPPEFKNYVYREDTPERENWEISLGTSQTKLFRQILLAVYGNVSIAKSNDEVELYDLFITPQLVEMQLATPAETGFSFFEAWLKYQITVSSEHEPTIRSFVMTAYGKQNKARFQRLQQGLHQAIENALRDAGAKLTVKLTSEPVTTSPQPTG